MLYAFGSNGAAQLGLGHTTDVSLPQQVSLPDETLDDPPVNIAAGGNHTLLQLRSGAIYATGDNQNGKCGVTPSVTSCLSTFKRVRIIQEDGYVIDSFLGCSASWDATILITANHEIFTCGTGNKGELGQGHGETFSVVPRRIRNFPPPGLKILGLESGMAHTVIVLSSGDVYGWGNGRQGQLGEPADMVWLPRKIQKLSFPVVRAACGSGFTYLIGHPDKGYHIILGNDKGSIRSDAPPSVPGWLDIAASWGSAYVLTSGGTMRSWGRNDHGQLGRCEMPRLQHIAAGSEHALAMTMDGQILTWGWAEHGNCGPGRDEQGDVKGRTVEICLPTKAEQKEGAPELKSVIGAGCATSWIWMTR